MNRTLACPLAELAEATPCGVSVDGVAVCLPAATPVATYPTRVSDGHAQVDVTEGARAPPRLTRYPAGLW